MKKPWKREEPVHERLRREAEAEGAIVETGEEDWAEEDWAEDAGTGALSADEPPVEEPYAERQAPFGSGFSDAAVDRGALSFLGVPRTRGDWDLVVTAEAPGLVGADELGFLAVENGDIFMDAQLPEGDVTPLAEAIEMQLEPPYRAFGVRQKGDLWAVAAKETEIGQFAAQGEELELTVRGDETELLVDGKKSFGGLSELEEIGREVADDFYVRAVRVEDDLWEITIRAI